MARINWILAVVVLAALLGAGCYPINRLAVEQDASAMQELEDAMAGKYAGTIVTLGNVLGGPWHTDYMRTLKEFQEQTGIKVLYEEIAEDRPAFVDRVLADKGPDLAQFTYPYAIMDFARQGKVVDVSQVIDMDTLRANFDQRWLDWATIQGPEGPILGGVWYFYNVDSVVWYPKAAFDAAGYRVPTTWAEMVALSDQIVADGGVPWCIENGNVPGLTAAHWLGDILRRTVSPAEYEQWLRGELKFDSPQVRRAFELLADIWFAPGYAFGGRETLNKNTLWQAESWLFAQPPKCWLLKEPSWVVAWDGSSPYTAFKSREYGKDYDFFMLPPFTEGATAPVQLEGHVVAMFHDRPEVRALLQYIASGAAVKAWVKLGAYQDLSPHKDASPTWIVQARDKAMAAAVGQAGDQLFLSPNAVFPVAEREPYVSINAYIDGSIDLDTALKQIDAVWPDMTLAPASAALPDTPNGTTDIGAAAAASFQPESGYADVNGTRLYYEMAGEGEPVVMIHGFGWDTRDWDYQFAELAKDYQVVRYDLRGFGKSAMPTEEPYAHADDLKALLDYLGIESAHVFGHSFGGELAINFALAYPEAVRSLVLIEPDIQGAQGLPPLTPEEEASLAAVAAALEQGDRIGAALAIVDLHPLVTIAKDVPGVRELVQAAFTDYTWFHFLNADPVVQPEIPAAERIEEITVPTLLVVGDSTTEFQKIEVDRLAETLPDAEKVVFENSDHFPHLLYPERFNALVLDFLAAAGGQ